MRKLIKKILKESDDLEWIRDIKTYIPFGDAKVGYQYKAEVINVEGFNIALEDCTESADVDAISLVKVLGRSREDYGSIYCVDNDVIPYWGGSKFCLDLALLDGNGKQLVSHWFAPDGLIQLQHI